MRVSHSVLFVYYAPTPINLTVSDLKNSMAWELRVHIMQKGGKYGKNSKNTTVGDLKRLTSQHHPQP